MKKTIILLITLISSVFIMADSFSFDSPAGGFKISVDETNSINSQKSSIVDEIAERVEYLQKKYNSKLNKLDQKRADKTIDQIFELLALLPEDIYISSQNVNPQPSSNVGISMNVSTNHSFDSSSQLSTTSKSEVIETQAQIVETVETAMSNSDFQSLLSSVKNEGFADDQLKIVRISAKSRYFSINQLIELIDIFSFADDKVECVKLVYPKIVDKDNSHSLLGAFTYSSDKEEVEQIINRY